MPSSGSPWAPTVSSHAEPESLPHLDLSNYLLIADKTGEVLTDVKNQPPRFRYHAQVTRGASGTWLVGQTAPALNEPC
jgi:hypothetical protein